MATATKLRLGPADHGRRLTLDEYLDADVEEGYRYELARGVVEVTHVPDPSHLFVVHWFYTALARYQADHPGRILVFGGGNDFRLWMPVMESGRNPDVSIVLVGTPKEPRGHLPPSLAIEVVSPGVEAHERDHETKRQEYLAYGLREYWIVDPFERRVIVLLRDGTVWVERVFEAGQEAEGLVLPGFRVPVAELWAAHDRGQGNELEG